MRITYWIVRHGLSKNQGMEIETIVHKLNQMWSQKAKEKWQELCSVLLSFCSFLPFQNTPISTYCTEGRQGTPSYTAVLYVILAVLLTFGGSVR